MEEDELREHAHMWDGTENWVLSAHYWTRVTLTVVFAGERPSVDELAALRRLREEFRAIPVRELKALLGDKSEVELGRFSSMESHEIEDRAARLQVPFSIRSIGESGVDYLPIQYKDGEEWVMLIDEDEELADRVTDEMLKHGVPIVSHIEE
ncbi:hypothetical protein IAD21_03952 [Abditibacteriota bacterium]|nr:hypothetical protein IAD21_03952 [Abditibacteriota bacterium]